MLITTEQLGSIGGLLYVGFTTYIISFSLYHTSVK